MLHLLKFAGRRRMAEHVLGERLARAVLKLDGQCGGDLVVVPVPLFAARERQRGFNQALLLAQAAVKVLRRERPEWKLWMEAGVMKRVKDTRSLFTLNPSQRRRNLVGAFRVEKSAADRIRGREVLLIDDIMTTGATARECARVLKRAGAAKVWVATAAKAQPESVKNLASVEVARWGDVAGHPGSQERDPGHPVRLVEPDVGRRVGF
jgi:ComF family protein